MAESKNDRAEQENTPLKLEDSEKQLWDWAWSGYLNYWNSNALRYRFIGASKCVNNVQKKKHERIKRDLRKGKRNRVWLER